MLTFEVLTIPYHGICTNYTHTRTHAPTMPQLHKGKSLAYKIRP